MGLQGYMLGIFVLQDKMEDIVVVFNTRSNMWDCVVSLVLQLSNLVVEVTGRMEIYTLDSLMTWCTVVWARNKVNEVGFIKDIS